MLSLKLENLQKELNLFFKCPLLLLQWPRYKYKYKYKQASTIGFIYRISIGVALD